MYEKYEVIQTYLSLNQQNVTTSTSRRVKFLIKYIFSKCNKICWKLRIWSYLLKKSLWKTSFFVQCSAKQLIVMSFFKFHCLIHSSHKTKEKEKGSNFSISTLKNRRFFHNFLVIKLCEKNIGTVQVFSIFLLTLFRP